MRVPRKGWRLLYDFPRGALYSLDTPARQLSQCHVQVTAKSWRRAKRRLPRQHARRRPRQERAARLGAIGTLASAIFTHNGSALSTARISSADVALSYGPGLAPGVGPAFGWGGSFLGTAASTAAGVIGGGLLLNSIRSMFGDHAGLGGQERSALGRASGSAADSYLAQQDRDQDQDQDQDDEAQAQEDQDQDQDQDDDGGDFGGDDTDNA